LALVFIENINSGVGFELISRCRFAYGAASLLSIYCCSEESMIFSI